MLHVQSIEKVSSSETIEEMARLDAEGTDIQNELFAISAEITRLQIRQESLNWAWLVNREQCERG